MLEDLAKINDQLLKMALSICGDIEQANDVVQETYLKLHESGKRYEDINTAYIYFTMKSIFLDTKRNAYLDNRVTVTDFNGVDIAEHQEEEKKPLQSPKLTEFEKLLIQALFGREITDSNGVIVKKIGSKSMLRLSKETGIPYRTIYTNFQNIKKKWKRGV
jgi:DNA-directed RNA polymerase specialized sigma24 family protein